MDISEFAQFINVVVCGICFCLGVTIKNSLDFIPNKYIPLIMAVVGVITNVWLNRWGLTPEIVLGGLVSGLASTGLWETLRNSTPIK